MINPPSTTVVQAISASPNVRAGEIAASPNVRTEEFSDQHRDLAQWLQVDLSASLALRAERAVQAYNMATLHMVEAGLLLASVRAEVGAEAFLAVLAERGMPTQRAYELMQGAALIARLSPAQREQVIALSKTKVMALAGASAAAVQAALEDDELDIDLIGVRQLKQRIRDLEANLTDTAVQRDTAEAEAEGMRKRLARQPGDRDDKVPLVVADMRAELMVLGKKGELAIAGLYAMGTELVTLAGNEQAHDWADATLRLAVSQLGALRLQLDGVIKSYLRELPGEDPSPTERSYLSKQEVLETARRFGELSQVNDYERALREWEREQARPKGKGRPKAKPVAPGGAA